MNVENYTQKKLKGLQLLFNILYFGLSYIGPIVFSIVFIANNSYVGNKWKFPIIFIFVLAIMILCALRLLEKNIDKIQTLNLDGTYNKKAVTTKAVLKFICNITLPVILILVAIIGGGKLKAVIDTAAVAAKGLVSLYQNFIIYNFLFYIAGAAINRFLLSQIEDEIDIRKKVSEENAVHRRINNLTNINK